jgi:hypothetical protein
MLASERFATAVSMGWADAVIGLESTVSTRGAVLAFEASERTALPLLMPDARGRYQSRSQLRTSVVAPGARLARFSQSSGNGGAV